MGLGIFVITRLQDNAPGWAAELLRRCGLRYQCPDASREEVRRGIETLKEFKDRTGLFYSVLDEREITPEFVEETLAALYSQA